MLQEEKLQQIINGNKKVTQVAQELGVSRQSIHAWLNRYRRFGIDGLITKKRKHRTGRIHNRTPKVLEQLIINLAQKYYIDGVITLADRLQCEYNTTLDPVTIYRILKRNHIRYGAYQTHTRKRWKIRLFSHRIPGKELQMDTKYPYGYKEGKVIYTIIDDATRWVFVWSYATANQQNTLDFIQKVIARAPFMIQKIRTDQGKEFIAHTVRTFMEKNHIIHRTNTPYCPEENGKIERFHKTLNEKALMWGFYPQDTLEEMQYKLTLFLHYYNYQKKHRGLGMNGLTPMQKLQELASVNLTLQCYINC
jgi:transposase InsO family protein